MKKYEKEVLQAFLDEEKRVLAELEDNYDIALHDINLRLENLLARNDADLPHVIYQIEYQKALKTQVQAILEQLQVNEFETVSDYLTRCYNTGFIGSMYSFHKQGLPFLIPIDQKQVVDAIRHKTKLKKKLYDELGVDIKKLQKTIAEEISRGISTGLGYGDIARNISLQGRIPLNRAMTIARTESHRIQCQATSDAQYKAKEKGADVLKQWDAALDGATRPNHRKLDGQIRELDEPFEVAGMKAMFPGDFGKASEDCNCRCAILQRARWALDEEELNELKERAEYYGLDKSKDFEDFQNKYLKASEKVRDSGQKMNGENTSQEQASDTSQNGGQKMNMASKDNKIVWGKPGIKISNKQYKEAMKYARSKGIELSGFKHFDGNVKTIYELVDDAESVAKLYPAINSGKKKMVIELAMHLSNNDFAVTNGHIISINANAYRDVSILKAEYDKLVESKWFVAGTDYHSIIKHEIGHVVANKYNIDGLALGKEITGISKDAYLLEYLEDKLSKYAASYEDGSEIIAECFASVYGSDLLNEFALKFVEKCGKIK